MATSEYGKIAKKVKTLVLEKKGEKVIRLHNILDKVFDCKTTDEMIDCSYELKQALMLHPLDQIKGIAKWELIQGSSVCRGWKSFPIYASINVYKRPCKGFESLKNWLKKYANYDLEIETFYYNRIFGKRENKEIISSELLAYYPKASKEILDWLRENKATRYNISIKERHTLERDEYAYRAETEWYGNEDNSMEISLMTKTTGKLVKKHTFTVY